MNTRTPRLLTAFCLVTISIGPGIIAAQDDPSQPNLNKFDQSELETESRSIGLDRAQAFSRTAKSHRATTLQSSARIHDWSATEVPSLAALETQSVGTGGGDIDEVEPNNPVAQAVALPTNVFGNIRNRGDIDFFAFQAFGGQLVTIEAFAARIRGSNLVADIGLFNSDGMLLDQDVGNEVDDPVIRYQPESDQVLIAGISDADDLGGGDFDYLLNITRGGDLEEDEPNGSVAQILPSLPMTIFGEIVTSSDVDFFSVAAEAGQTLIVDVDADVLGSGLDSAVNLADAVTGTVFFYNDQEDRDDSRFNIVLPHSGRYIVGIGAFNSNSSGFYRLNLSLTPGGSAPSIAQLRRVAKKLIEVEGLRLEPGAIVEVNGESRKTTRVDAGTLRAKVKLRSGDVVTVKNPPDGRRSNPLVF